MMKNTVEVQNLKVGQKFHTSESATVYTVRKVHSNGALATVEYSVDGMVCVFVKPALATVYIVG